MLSPEQCRGARAMLQLSRADLTKVAGVTAATVENFEAGRRKLRPTSIARIRAALELAGAEFLDGEDGGAVRLRSAPSKEELKQEPETTEDGFTFLVNFGERARKARLSANLRQADVYERAGIPQAHLSQMELGNINVTLMTAYKLAKVLGKDVKDLL
jgi:transcriptional regulator with XRE-family HTH domain